MIKPLQTSVRVSYYRFNSNNRRRLSAHTSTYRCIYYAYKSHEGNFDLDRKREFEFKFHNIVFYRTAHGETLHRYTIAAMPGTRNIMYVDC